MEAKDKNELSRFLLICLGIMFLTAVLGPIVLAGILGPNVADKYALLTSTVLQAVIMGVALLILGRRKVKLNIDFKILRQLPAIFAVPIVAFAVVRPLSDGIRWIRFANDMYDSTPTFTKMDVGQFFLVLLLLALIPAVCEEAFYRVSARTMLSKYKPAVTVLIPTVCFALAHVAVGWESLLSALVLGFLLIVHYNKHQNYLSVVIMHFLFNTLELLFAHIVKCPTDTSYLSARASSPAEATFLGLMYVAAALALAAVAVLVTALIRQKIEKRQGAASTQAA